MKSMFPVNIRGILGDQRENRIGHKGLKDVKSPAKIDFLTYTVYLPVQTFTVIFLISIILYLP